MKLCECVRFIFYLGQNNSTNFRPIFKDQISGERSQESGPYVIQVITCFRFDISTSSNGSLQDNKIFNSIVYFSQDSYRSSTHLHFPS